jgi:hypothetical protein
MPDGTKAAQPRSEPRLRALHRLLRYALAESEELAIPLLDKLLGAAMLVVGESVKGPSSKAEASTKPNVLRFADRVRDGDTNPAR